MALADTPFENALKAAFALTSWVDNNGVPGTCSALGTAISTYLASGTVATTVSGTFAGPPPTPFSGAVGTGVIVTQSPASLQQALVPTTASNVSWALFAQQIATETLNYIALCTCSLSVSGAAIGTGVGVAGFITPIGASVFTSGMISLFAAQKTWVAISSDIVNLFKTLLSSCIVATIDAGANPPWAGAGVGLAGCIS